MPKRAGDSIGKINDRETGARKFPAFPDETDRDKEGLEAAENESSGLMEPMSDIPEKVRKSDGRNPPHRHASEDADRSDDDADAGEHPPSRRPT